VKPCKSFAGEVGCPQMGGLICDWSRCLEESVEHTVAFMGSYVPSRSCGAVPFCRDLLVFGLKVVTSEE
jgi:hypothetical protein